jgi:lipooligosaccharide transport system ATP-binding protein
VRDVSFEVRAGECFGLLGPNGAGKSTTIQCITGFYPPTSGEVFLGGVDVQREPKRARRILGVCAQDETLDSDFRAFDQLVRYATFFRVPVEEGRRRAENLLLRFGLAEKSGEQVESLSGGMKRRLQVARALISEPTVLVLDEPTTGLDPEVRRVLWQILMEERGKGAAILLCTHYMDEAERLCDRVGILDHGAMIAEDSPRELIGAQIEPHVVEVYGEGVPDWARDVAPRHAERVELTGETAFCYCQEATALLQAMQGHPRLRALSRAANLEDVFIKLTGRDIRD